MKNTLLFRLLPLFIVLFLDSMGGSILWPLVKPLFYSQHGLLIHPINESVKNIYYGLTLGSYFIASIFSPPILGKCSDSVGRKKILLVCLLGSLIGFVLSIFALYFHYLFLFIIGRVIDGLTAGNFVIAQASIIDVSDEKTKPILMGYILLAISLGYIIGPLLSGALSIVSVQLPFYVISIVTFFNILLLAYYYVESKPLILKTEQVPISFSKIAKLLIAAFTLMQIAWAFYVQYICVFIVKQYHFSNLVVGYYSALMGVGLSLALSLLLKRLLAFFPAKLITFGSLILMMIGIFLIASIHSQVVLWLCVVPSSIAIALAYSLFVTHISDHFVAGKQGYIMGILGMISAIAFSLGAIFSGVLMNLFLSLNLFIAAALMLICVLVFRFFIYGKI